MKRQYRIALVSDFNVANLSALLRKESKVTECIEAPYGQAIPTLLNRELQLWREPFHAVVVWTRPTIVSKAFASLTAGEDVPEEALDRDVDEFSQILTSASDAARSLLVPAWTAPELGRGLGMADLSNSGGIARALARMNRRLVECAESDRRIMVMDSRQWLADGSAGFDARLWYLSKTPFRNVVFVQAAADVLAALEGLHGRSRKVLVLDLDNTLWAGVVGDDGWERLRIGGHDPIGEAYADFQRGLKRLCRRGVVLAIASKNEESIALEAIDRHPEMVLRRDDFAAMAINWRDKAANICALVSELNLGLDSVVFLDDSPFERARVREALPDVLVPDLPDDPLRYPEFLARLRCFDSPFLSEEDRSRNALYKAERLRTELKREAPSLDAWLSELDLRVEADLLGPANLERAAQLLNKTNQMNLATRRLTQSELAEWADGAGHRFWTFRVRDRFGDYGICGLLSIDCDGETARIADFVLSCRVLGRGVEDAMLKVAIEHAREQRCNQLYAKLVETPKNGPCKQWLTNHKLFGRSGNRFSVDLTEVGIEAAAGPVVAQSS